MLFHERLLISRLPTGRFFNVDGPIQPNVVTAFEVVPADESELLAERRTSDQPYMLPCHIHVCRQPAKTRIDTLARRELLSQDQRLRPRVLR